MILQFAPVDLRTENLSDPIGINQEIPEHSWRLPESFIPRRQSAWQIQAASSPDFGSGDMLWDSGKVLSSSSFCHRYGGEALKSRARVFWRVRIWDDADCISDWSETASFELGLLSNRDWDAQYLGFPPGWAGSALLYKAKFTCKNPDARIRLYLSGPGWSEVQLNGKDLNNSAVLQPAQTDFNQSVHYLTFDLTGICQAGENELIFHTGSGWYGTPILRYRVEEDGNMLTRSHVFSLPLVSPSPVVRQSIYGGEVFDGKTAAEFDWNRVTRNPMRVSGPAGIPRGLEEEPITLQEELPVVRWIPLGGDSYTADFGRNFAGWCRLSVKAPAGSRITLRFAEFLHPDNHVNQANLLEDYATDIYIAAGSGETETFEPHFTYHGFRYVEVNGLPSPPDENTLHGIVLRSNCTPRGTFECSDPLVNRIFNMIRHTEESNLFAVPTDCPQRTERMGWLNDMMARCESSLYLFDTANLMAKWLRDIKESQDPETGEIPMTAPFYWGFAIDPVCSSFIESAYLLYIFGGRKALLEELYPAQQRWMQCMLDHCDPDGIFRTGGWVGDWVPPVKFNNNWDSPRNHTVPEAIVSTALMYYAGTLMAKIAAILGKTDDEKAMQETCSRIRQDFLTAFAAGPGKLKDESQSAYAYAIYCGLFPEAERPAAAARLAELFKENNCKHTTGNIGTKYLLEVLGSYGYAELVWNLLVSEDYPGWGYMLANGATTLWERWELEEGNGMNSHNHPMLGCPCSWLYRFVSGIRLLPGSCAFDRFELKPIFLKDLDYCRAAFNARPGMIRSQWQRKEGKVIFEFTIPPNCTAEVTLPDGRKEDYPAGSHQIIYNENNL